MSLEQLRQKIDEIDTRILGLLNERLGLACEVGEVKKQHGLDVYAPEREEQLLRRLNSINKESLLPEASLRAIYREIISASISLEKELIVAYLGPEATWSHQAARSKFGSSVTFSPQTGIADVFGEVQRGRADFGVVPIENSTEGSVGQTMDEFIESDLQICGELLLKIDHNLAGRIPREKILRVYSHSQSFGQCRNWLRFNMPEIDLIPVASNAKAAATAAGESNAAAICSPMAAELHGLRVLEASIQDYSDNSTRFLVLGRQAAKPTGADKTSLMLIVEHKAGALQEALEPMTRHGISLTRIESRPSRLKAWEYCFFIDLAGHTEEENLSAALSELSARAKLVKILGSYPVCSSN